MKTNLMSLVGTGDDPSLGLGPDLGIGNARETREGIEEEPAGRTIEKGIGMQETGT